MFVLKNRNTTELSGANCYAKLETVAVKYSSSDVSTIWFIDLFGVHIGVMLLKFRWYLWNQKTRVPGYCTALFASSYG